MLQLLTQYLSEEKISKLPRRELIRLLYLFLMDLSDQSPIIVDELPAYIEPGKLIIFENQLWSGLAEGQSSLPAGTPWPAKGYKSFVAVINDVAGSESHQVTIFESDIGIPTFLKFNSAQYRLQFTDIPSTVNQYVPYLSYPQPFEGLPEFLTASIWFNPSNNIGYVSLWKPYEGDDETLIINLDLKFYPPPNLDQP